MSRLNYVVCTQTRARTSGFQERFFIKKSVDKIRSCRQRSIVFVLLIIINRLTLCLQGNLFSHLLIFSKSVIFLKKLFMDNHIK